MQLLRPDYEKHANYDVIICQLLKVLSLGHAYYVVSAFKQYL